MGSQLILPHGTVTGNNYERLQAKTDVPIRLSQSQESMKAVHEEKGSHVRDEVDQEQNSWDEADVVNRRVESIAETRRYAQT